MVPGSEAELRGEPGGDPLGPVAQLAEAERAVVLVDGEQSVGRERGAPLDQRPETRRSLDHGGANLTGAEIGR